VPLRHAGLWIGLGSVDTPHTGAAIVEMLREIKEILDQRPVTSEELEAQKTELVMTFPDDFATASGIAGELARLVLYGEPLDSWQTYGSRVRGTDPEAVLRVGGEQLQPDDLYLVVTGDRVKVEDQLNQLGLGNIGFHLVDEQ
jgi:zinc protease